MPLIPSFPYILLLGKAPGLHHTQMGALLLCKEGPQLLEKLIPMDVGDVREGRKTGALSPKVQTH